MLPDLFSLIDCPPVDTTDLQSVRQAQRALIAAIPVPETPVFFHTLGFASSGKTTLIEFCRTQENLFPFGFFSLAFDRLMESCPAYQQDYKTLGAEAAFRKWELPARRLGYELLQEAVARRIPVVFEHSGARDDHVALLKAAKNEWDYRIVILELRCTPETALHRAQSRERFMPERYVYERQKVIDGLRCDYKAIADQFRIYDTDGAVPRLLEID